MFHVKRWRSYSPNIDIWAVHYFQADAVFEGDEVAGELLCRIVVNRVNHPTEVFSVELADLIDVLDPDGDMLDFHSLFYGWP